MKGLVGLPGPPGFGAKGVVGKPGLRGIEGSSGAQGSPGPVGDDGIPAAVGLKGRKTNAHTVSKMVFECNNQIQGANIDSDLCLPPSGFGCQ